MSVRQIEKEITCVIIDGSAILYVVNWPANGTLKDYVGNFKSYINKMLRKVDVYLVFDRYKPFSTNVSQGPTEQDRPVRFTNYCRFGNVRENLIFANIREFVVSRIQSPH